MEAHEIQEMINKLQKERDGLDPKGLQDMQLADVVDKLETLMLDFY